MGPVKGDQVAVFFHYWLKCNVNFLSCRNIVFQNDELDDFVLEVCFCKGSMTEALDEEACRIIAVELDLNLSKIAEKQI